MKCKCVCVWWGWGVLRAALRQAAERRFHCHFLPFSACLRQTKATADSWFSGGEKAKEKPTDKHRLHSTCRCHFFTPSLPFPFFSSFAGCWRGGGASGALNMQLLCHYCQPGCVSANRRLNALPPPLLPPPPSSSHYRLSSRVPHANHRTGS